MPSESITGGDARSRRYKTEVVRSALFKVISAAATFAALPITIKYLGVEVFGVWSAMLAIVSWVILFDLGLGNGLRNKVADAVARGDESIAAEYAATAYQFLGVLLFIIWLCAMAASFALPWQRIFNIDSVAATELAIAVQVLMTFLLANFWIGLVVSLASAMQRMSWVSGAQMFANLLALALVLMLSKLTVPSLVLIASAYGGALIISNIVLSCVVFKYFPYLWPVQRANFARGRSIINLGSRFFIIQLAGLMVFLTDKMLITQLLGPAYVTEYELMVRLMSILTLAHTTLSAPLWSAYTEAFSSGDFLWIKRTLGNQIRYFSLFIAAAVVLLLGADTIYSVWIGADIAVSTNTLFWVTLLALLTVWNNIFAMFVNGVGEIGIQVVTAIIAIIVNIPISIFLVKIVGLGLSGIAIATILSLLPAAIALPLHARFILRRHVETPL